MFCVEETFRYPVPKSILGDGGSCYRLVEIIADRPVWMLHVLSTAEKGTPPHWRLLQINSIVDALHAVETIEWVRMDLLVLIPRWMSRHPGLELHQVSSLWKCIEPEAGDTCWRIETASGAYLDSVGTKLGDELTEECVWRQAKPHSEKKTRTE